MGCRCRLVSAEFATKLPAAEADDAGRLVCDHFSLQLWCLAGPERWPACAFFADVPHVAARESS